MTVSTITILSIWSWNMLLTVLDVYDGGPSLGDLHERIKKQKQPFDIELLYKWYIDCSAIHS